MSGGLGSQTIRPPAAWSSDLGPTLPPRGLVEAGLTILDMAGLVGALTLAPNPRTVR